MNQETSVSANEIPEQLQLKDNGAEFRPIVHPSVNFAWSIAGRESIFIYACNAELKAVYYG